MPSTDLLTYVEEAAGHPIGWDELESWDESAIRSFHGKASRYVEIGGTLDDDEVVIYVKLLRRADDLGMNLSDASESIVEVLL